MAETNDQEKHLGAAVAAAGRKDAPEYLVELAATHALDGISRSMEHHWPGVDQATLEEAMIASADALYAKVSGGGVVRSPGGFLWGTANNFLLKRNTQGRLNAEQFDDESWPHNVRDDVGDDSSQDRVAMRAEALRFARSVLPMLGQENVVRVMGYIFDCVESGELYIDNRHIAEVLGLTIDTVRKTKHRGFKRLEREARRRGVMLGEGLTVQGESERENERDEEGE